MPRTTRCTEPAGAPYNWVDYIDHGSADFVDLDAWLSSLTIVMRQQVEGDIDALLALAAEGGIASDDTAVIKPVALFPELWELRWSYRGRAYGGVREVRQYHAEPPARPKYLVAVHRHLKDLSGTSREIKSAQEQAMAQGKLRHMAGDASDWGTRA